MINDKYKFENVKYSDELKDNFLKYFEDQKKGRDNYVGDIFLIDAYISYLFKNGKIDFAPENIEEELSLIGHNYWKDENFIKYLVDEHFLSPKGEFMTNDYGCPLFKGEECWDEVFQNMELERKLIEKELESDKAEMEYNDYLFDQEIEFQKKLFEDEMRIGEADEEAERLLEEKFEKENEIYYKNHKREFEDYDCFNEIEQDSEYDDWKFKHEMDYCRNHYRKR